MSKPKSTVPFVGNNFRERWLAGWDTTRGANAAQNFNWTITQFMVMIRIFCCVLLVLVTTMLLGWMASAAMNRSRGVSGRSLLRHGRCFLPDLLEHRVPNHEPLDRDSPPVTVGRICFDDVQMLVDWDIKESFSQHFKLTDFLLRGPLEKHGDHQAPAVLTFGLLDEPTEKPKHDSKHRRSYRLAGSIKIERTLLAAIFENPTHYYLSLEGVELTAQSDIPHEIARDKLWRPIKI